MHRLGGRHTEVAVISDDLIRRAVCTDLDPRNVNAVHDETSDQQQPPQPSSVDFARLRALSLSFQNILKIDNLETLRHLVSLQLDNNVIQEIDGIAHLVSLQWLDLSFNNISEIRGLDSLVHLTDLTLYNNGIAKIENLDALQKLQVLSLGNNAIATTDGLLDLKRLQALRVLNLSGNPVCSDPEYRPFLLAHLNKLQYLDYALIDASEVAQAREQYQDELEELKEVKAIEDAAQAREAEQVAYLALLKSANILTIETLLADMFREDMEMSKIEVLPGLRNIIDDYSEKAKAATEDVKALLLDKHSVLTREVDSFEHKYGTIQDEAQRGSVAALENYRRTVKRVLKQVTGGGGGGDHASSPTALQLLQQAETASIKLHGELMDIESDVVETAQELITVLEQAVESSGAEARDIATEHFRTIEVLENNFFENVSQLAVTLLERMATEDGEEDDFLSDECRAILNDRDALNNAINGSHDIHIGKLLAQEDVMREQSVARIADIVKSTKEKEWTRNRHRVAEILAIRETHQTEIGKVREELTRVEDEFY